MAARQARGTGVAGPMELVDTAERELPSEVVVKYIEPSSNFLQSVQTERRVNVAFRNVSNVELPIVMIYLSAWGWVKASFWARSRRFAIVDFPSSYAKAVREARLRTEMLFEPRPEYNHATNALAIVGRRSLSENLFLDRRAFYNSYDPDSDKNGAILNGILTPLVPVCGGINLEYLFSRLDNRVYGAGSKLPHNVFSLIGVGNGSEGDLRTGLPEQMIEIHDPVRLMILVEQKKEIVLKVLKANRAVMQWIEKDWVKFCIYDHTRRAFLWYHKGKFYDLDLDGIETPVFPDSISAYMKQRENVTPALIRKGA